MRYSSKPVHKCYSCLLNLADHCWLYRYPRGQWRGGKKCPAFDNKEIYRGFRDWKKQPSVKSGKELRREFFRTRRRTVAKRRITHSTSSHVRQATARQAGQAGNR